MIHQKLISAKIEYSLLEEVDTECYLYAVKRNKAINEGLRLWLDEREREREQSYWRKAGLITHGDENLTHREYILSRLTAENKKFLDLYMSVTHASIERVISKALLLLQRDYEKKPFSHL